MSYFATSSEVDIDEYLISPEGVKKHPVDVSIATNGRGE